MELSNGNAYTCKTPQAFNEITCELKYGVDGMCVDIFGS